MTCRKATAFLPRIRPAGESRKRAIFEGSVSAKCSRRLRRAFLGHGGEWYSRFFPRAFGALGSRFVPVFDAVVMVGLAHRAQRFVVQAGQAEAFLQFFGELLQGLEMVGSGRDFGLGGFQKLLIATVDQLRDLAADHVAGISEY